METKRTPYGGPPGWIWQAKRGLSQRCSPVGTFRRVAIHRRISARDFEPSKSLDEFNWPKAIPTVGESQALRLASVGNRRR